MLKQKLMKVGAIRVGAFENTLYGVFPDMDKAFEARKVFGGRVYTIKDGSKPVFGLELKNGAHSA